MTTTTFTVQQKLTLIKHLAGGKTAEMVATIMHTTKDAVLDVARNHGYPDKDKLAWAADVMAKNIAEGDQPPERRLSQGEVLRPRGEVVSSPVTPAAPLTRPDELRVLLNTAKSHPSKRIQAAADRIFDQVARLRALIAEDEEKNAEKRRIAAEKAAARAEVQRLERELAAAKAKLRPKAGQETSTPATTSSTEADADGPTAKEIRAWAKTNDVACPEVGRVPAAVRDAYLEATSQAAAS